MTLALVIGIVVGALIGPFLVWLFRSVTIRVEEGEAVLITSFGKLERTLKTPGLHLLLSRPLPWVRCQPVSLRRDFRLLRDVHVNDARGTTVIADMWAEFRIVDPAKAIFSVADWDRSLRNLISHAATSILGNRDFNEILRDRKELGQRLQIDIGRETTRWGIQVDQVFIAKVSLLPEVARQIIDTVAARLERAKADIDEIGRLAVAQLEAETGVRVARLVAEAKGQYPLAIGSALAKLRETPEIFTAYEELHRLSLLRPHRTVAFRGFDGEVRAIDAAMLPTTTSGPPS